MYTLHEVADILRLPYEQVRDKVYAGAWPHVKFSPRNRRMTQEHIDRVVAMSAHEPAPPQSTSTAHERRKRVQDYLRAV
jgi:hypothetical protein